ncbi:D-alanine--D-alanine ligase [Luminiphilus sp.]|jgi:D-alanine-D-alanine ligase|nr:D-alanine--D-alanine ligase [Luminiphilus sp.]
MVSIFSGKKIAVTLGGNAAERSISLESGGNVAQILEQSGASVLRVDPSENGWLEQLAEASFVFNLLHGPGGEDGTIQGLFEWMNLPYSGSGVLGSALTMDKIRTKLLWQGTGLPTPRFVSLSAETDWSSVITDLGAAFVKPALEGSSLGMTKVSDGETLKLAYQSAVAYGSGVLAEQFIAGEEYTVAILGDRALPSIRIEVPGDFYDFDAKYLSEKTVFTCPSGLSQAEEKELADLALEAFRLSGCQVWGRVDLIREHSGRWQLLEVNTVPGMTSHSLVPMAARAAGLSSLEMLIEIFRASEEVRRGQR